MKPPENEKENPRTTRVRKVILDSAVELLINNGAKDVTATRIADETGVARTTIYRQWPDQASLVLASIEMLVSSDREAPDTGDIRSDLTTALSDLKYRLEHKQVRPVLGALIDHASRDTAFVAAQQRFMQGLSWPTAGVLEAAQARGDLPADLDCAVGTALLVGPILHQYILMHDEVADDLIALVVSQFLSAHTPS